MIRIRRPATPPAVLVGADSPGPRETARAIAFYSKPANHGKSFKYAAYSHADVVAALRDLFHGKCAYCESPYVATQPADIEHWRPKGSVEGAGKRRIRPGYYWLAACWRNLLPSCIDCNRRRYHEIPGAKGAKILLGKQDAFPLFEKSPRAARPGMEKHERPLLLHPCEDEPSRFLAFPPWDPDKDDDARGLVRPKPRVAADARRRAETSIQVYGLNREGLVFARKRRFLEIIAQIRRVEEAAERVRGARGAERRKRETTIYEREMDCLLDLQADSSPYALMSREIIARFLRARL